MKNLNSKEIVLELIEELKDELEKIDSGKETRETRFIYMIEYAHNKLKYTLLKKLEEENANLKKNEKQMIKAIKSLTKKSVRIHCSPFIPLPSLNKKNVKQVKI